MKRWKQVPEQAQKDILARIWCPRCQAAGKMQLREGEMVGRSLVLRGTCRICGGDVARLIEADD